MSANDTIIPEDYEELKKEYVILQKELDVTKQELHGCKRQIQLFESLKIDYQHEIEILQSKESKEKHMLEEKVLSLEENSNNLKIRYREERQSLENRILKLQEENEILNTDIISIKNTDVSTTSRDNSNNFNDKIEELKDTNDELMYRIEELKIMLETAEETKSHLEEQNLEYTKHISELKNHIDCKSEELSDANNLIQKLNEEIFSLKIELEGYKSQPLDKLSKGNSLFAEVDDRRVYLEKTINNMKTEFITMKQERTKHLNTIRHLKLENKMFLDNWKTDINEKEDDYHTVIKAYKNQIATLEKQIESYKKGIETKPIILSKEDGYNAYEFYNVRLKKKIEEIEELKEQLTSQTLTETLLSQALKQANEDKRNWKLKAFAKEQLPEDQLNNIEQAMQTIQVSCQNEDNSNSKMKCLKNSKRDTITIDDTFEDEDAKEMTYNKIKNEIADETVKVEQKRMSKIFSDTTKIKSEVLESIKDENDKENDVQNVTDETVVKKVTFASISESPKKSNLRKCRKVIVCKPISWSSLQKSKE